MLYLILVMILRRFTLFFNLLFIMILITGCSPAPVSRTGFFFDTVVTITLHGGNESDLDAAFELCGLYENLLSKTRDTSDVWRVNNANGQPVGVSDEMIEILAISEKYYHLSGGSFDVTCGAETALWDFTGAGAGVIPSPDQLIDAVSRTGFEYLHIEGNMVWLDNNARLDLGAVAKGYIADRIAGFLISRGVTGAVIDLGGDIVTIGQKNDGKPWAVAIRSPQGKYSSGGYAGIVEIKEGAVVTSGVYERFFEVDGTRYHHILNPQTGMPAETDIMSITVIAGSAAEGDALSTTCLLLGSERAMELIKSLNDEKTLKIDACLILNDGSVLSTKEDLVT